MSVTPKHLGSLDRFMHHVKKTENGCWEWIGSRTISGYGQFRIGSQIDGTRRQVLAHRLSYESFVGPVPAGLTIDHLCRNPSCVNPAHLDPVTMRENILRGNSLSARRARQTHCIRGHKFTPENTRISKRGERVCRTCHREYRHRSLQGGTK